MAQDCLKGSIKCPFKCGNSNTVTVCLFHELSGINLNQTHQKEKPPWYFIIQQTSATGTVEAPLYSKRFIPMGWQYTYMSNRILSYLFRPLAQLHVGKVFKEGISAYSVQWFLSFILSACIINGAQLPYNKQTTFPE